MDNMILGRYIPGNSIVHRLDPRSKLVAMILLIMIVFWANNPITNLILFVVTGTLNLFKGPSKDSTAVAKLNGMVVKVSKVEKKIINTKRQKMIPACSIP